MSNLDDIEITVLDDVTNRVFTVPLSVYKLDKSKKRLLTIWLHLQMSGICPGCDRFVAEEDMTLDHIRPLSHGGTDSLKNLQALCFRCNAVKGNGTMDDLTRRLERDRKIVAQARLRPVRAAKDWLAACRNR